MLRIIFNIIWILFGGFEIFSLYIFGGCIMCLTIIGIPYGLKLFQIGIYALCPFGSDIVIQDNFNGFLAIIFNIFWLPFGLIIFLLHFILGILFCLTIIGIPFGYQHFKLATYAIFPFGRSMRY